MRAKPNWEKKKKKISNGNLEGFGLDCSYACQYYHISSSHRIGLACTVLKYFVRALTSVREEGVNGDDLEGITTGHL